MLRRLCAPLLLLFAATSVTMAAPAIAAPAGDGWASLPAADEPASNPLKGFIPYQGDYDAFPHSMEWSYFSVADVMTGPDDFDWAVVDTALDDIASRGHQTALRFYLDHPGETSGVPQHLLDAGLTTRPYDDYGNDGVSVSPDYDDPALREAVADFIAALGERYDGDARIGFIQAGLLGFWGEWHTYPHDGSDGETDWMASEATRLDVLTGFDAAFDATQLQVRYADALNADLPFGYHDDSFALATMTSPTGWHFMDQMADAATTTKWQEHSIGGELRPELQSCIFSTVGCPEIEEGGDNDFAGGVEQTHVSWLLNQFAFDEGYPAADQDAALAGARSLGYSFRATSAAVPVSTEADTLDVGVEIANIGRAPFYYDWPAEVALLDDAGRVTSSTTTDWLVGDIPAGSSQRLTAALELRDVPEDDYTVAMRVPNPLEGAEPIRFANEGQDAAQDGWLTVGSTTVVGAVPVRGPEPTAPEAAPAPAPADTAATPSPVVPPSAPAPAAAPAADAAAPTLADTGSSAAVPLAFAAGLLALGVAFAARRRVHG